MEAKVDVRKLQLLNDRINQTIEALNQVRLSVHGLTHSAQIGQAGGWALQGAMSGQPIGQMGQLGQSYGQPFLGSPYGVQMGLPFGQQINNPAFQAQLVPGIQHTPAYTSIGLGAMTQGPWAAPFLAHTSPIEDVERRVAEVKASDPNRLAQTFPYVFSI